MQLSMPFPLTFLFLLVLTNEWNALFFFLSYFAVTLTLILTDSGRIVLDCRHTVFLLVCQQTVLPQMPVEA